METRKQAWIPVCHRDALENKSNRRKDLVAEAKTRNKVGTK